MILLLPSLLSLLYLPPRYTPSLLFGSLVLIITDYYLSLLSIDQYDQCIIFKTLYKKNNTGM